MLCTHTVVSDEPYDLARVGVLVRRLRQPADHRLELVDTRSAQFRERQDVPWRLTCFLLVAAKIGGAPGGL